MTNHPLNCRTEECDHLFLICSCNDDDGQSLRRGETTSDGVVVLWTTRAATTRELIQNKARWDHKSSGVSVSLNGCSIWITIAVHRPNVRKEEISESGGREEKETFPEISVRRYEAQFGRISIPISHQIKVMRAKVVIYMIVVSSRSCKRFQYSLPPRSWWRSPNDLPQHFGGNPHLINYVINRFHLIFLFNTLA